MKISHVTSRKLRMISILTNSISDLVSDRRCRVIIDWSSMYKAPTVRQAQCEEDGVYGVLYGCTCHLCVHFVTFFSP